MSTDPKTTENDSPDLNHAPEQDVSEQEVHLDGEIDPGLFGSEFDEGGEMSLQGLPDAEKGKVERSSKDALKEELATTKDQLLRALADVENVRKRAQREKEETAQYAISKFATDLLSVADNFDRAIQSLQSSDDSGESAALKPLLEGVEITQKELAQVFKKHKIEGIEAMNQAFDPNLHQAVVEVDDPSVDPGTVVQEMQKGYTISGRLLRPSMVAVSK